MSVESKTKRASRYVDDDDDESYMAPDTAKKADWKSNPFVPLGAFGGAVLLAAGIVFGRRNSGWGWSQTIMQARVAAQGACVAGLIGVGIYSSMEASKKKDLEASRLKSRN